MRIQIAAANWKMNLTFQQGEKLLDDILEAEIKLKAHQRTIFAVPSKFTPRTSSFTSAIRGPWSGFTSDTSGRAVGL